LLVKLNNLEIIVKLLNLPQCTVILLIIVSLLDFSNVSGSSVSPTPATYTNPFTYCAAADTIDAPDARYTGPKVPEIIAEGLRKAFNTPDTPLDVYISGSFWRCMNGKVYACTVGANLPCEAKADINRTATQAERDFCRQNPGADTIPMVVTGRETVYEWRCNNGMPEIVRQFTKPDTRGFLSNIWYEISPK
jgi:hypothetical protein